MLLFMGVTPECFSSWEYATNSVLYVPLLHTEALMLHSTGATATGLKLSSYGKRHHCRGIQAV